MSNRRKQDIKALLQRAGKTPGAKVLSRPHLETNGPHTIELTSEAIEEELSLHPPPAPPSTAHEHPGKTS